MRQHSSHGVNTPKMTSLLSGHRILMAQNRNLESRIHLSTMILCGARVTLECCGSSILDHLINRPQHYQYVLLDLEEGSTGCLWTAHQLLELSLNLPIIVISDCDDVQELAGQHEDQLHVFPESTSAPELCRLISLQSRHQHPVDVLRTIF